ncbi:transcriptional regulator [Bradyrhizobiaceae bacterium SG-6C]|nr:transcriptional regulator [Bradyrhizobiaceae bacterium SG-6C]
MMSAPAGLAEALLASASDAIIATDRGGVVTYWNPGAVRIFGFSPDEAIGQSLDFIIPENLRARHWDGYRHTMATGTSRYGAGDLLSAPALTKGGKRISVEFTIVMLRDERGLPDGTVAVLRDVTKGFAEKLALRRELAELQQTASQT